MQLIVLKISIIFEKILKKTWYLKILLLFSQKKKKKEDIITLLNFNFKSFQKKFSILKKKLIWHQ